jgi:type VI secretion system protein ImpJ
MFLRPQHFQSQGRFFEARLRASVDAIRARAWGVTELAIDENLATIGKFAILRASGVLPDGTPFAIPERGRADPMHLGLGAPMMTGFSR